MSESISINPLGSRLSKWGEGPIFWKEHLLYVDIEGHALIRLNPDNGAEKVWDMRERIGTVVPRESGGYICAGDSGIYFFLLLDRIKRINSGISRTNVSA